MPPYLRQNKDSLLQAPTKSSFLRAEGPPKNSLGQRPRFETAPSSQGLKARPMPPQLRKISASRSMPSTSRGPGRLKQPLASTG